MITWCMMVLGARASVESLVLGTRGEVESLVPRAGERVQRV